MVVPRINLRIIYFLCFLIKKRCQVVGHDYATCQANIGCFQFIPSIYNVDSI